MEAVELVKIRELVTIYKDGVEANSIQVAHVMTSDGEPLQFDVIVGKGLYEVGQDVIYIQPDHCLPQTKVFSEYHMPGGDVTKCKLGKKGRIKSIKFNFNFLGDTMPIYSIGIILPVTGDVLDVLSSQDGTDLTTALGITKYVADDSFDTNGQKSGNSEEFPRFLYKTDETMIQNLKRVVDSCYEDGEVLSFSIKRNGSSITDYYVTDDEQGVCSRSLKKSLDQSYVSTYTRGDVTLFPYFDKTTSTHGWFDDSEKKFYTNEEAEATLTPTIMVHRDAWVDTVTTHGYHDSLVNYCKENGVALAMRGELVGQGNKGSGNKLNMDAKTSVSDVIWFGVDDLTSGYSKRINYAMPHNLKDVCEKLGFKYTEPVIEGVFDYTGIISKCHDIFAGIKTATGQVVEGIVIRTRNSNRLSCKYINPEYDAKS